MGIEVTESGTLVTGEAITVYDLLAFRGALSLEIRVPGMRMRNGFSIVKQAIKRGYVTPGTRSKRRAYAEIDAQIVALGLPSLPLAA